MSVILNPDTGITVNGSSLNPTTGYKNKVINGNIDIWQRGTSGLGGIGSFLTADRWYNIASIGSNVSSVSRVAFTLGQTTVPNNPKYHMRNTITANTGYVYMSQRIEDVNTLAGKTVTLSFWAKADSSKSIKAEFAQNFGTAGSSEVAGLGVTDIVLTSSWQKFTITTILPSISNKTVGTGSYLELRFWLSNANVINAANAIGFITGQTITFDLAQVQLEESPVATSFEMRPPRIELELCQRYYQIVTGYSSFINGNILSQNQRTHVPLICNMRSTISVGNSLATLYSSTAGSHSPSSLAILNSAYLTHNGPSSSGVYTAIGYRFPILSEL